MSVTYRRRCLRVVIEPDGAIAMVEVGRAQWLGEVKPVVEPAHLGRLALYILERR